MAPVLGISDPPATKYRAVFTGIGLTRDRLAGSVRLPEPAGLDDQHLAVRAQARGETQLRSQALDPVVVVHRRECLPHVVQRRLEERQLLADGVFVLQWEKGRGREGRERKRREREGMKERER
jgi:hypothetical protein